MFLFNQLIYVRAGSSQTKFIFFFTNTKAWRVLVDDKTSDTFVALTWIDVCKDNKKARVLGVCYPRF